MSVDIAAYVTRAGWRMRWRHGPAMDLRPAISWAVMFIPLLACAAIWGIGDETSVEVAWLHLLHGAVGTAAMA